jgi:hypothetical protein
MPARADPGSPVGRAGRSRTRSRTTVAADEFVDEGVGGAGGVGADQDRPPAGWLGQGQQHHRQHLHIVGCGVGPGIAGPQDHGQRLPGAIAAVQPATKRVKPVAVLVGRRRALLVGVRLDKGRVHVQDQRPRWGRAQCPGALADPGQRRPQPADPTRIGGQLLGQDAPGGRRGGDLVEQLRLVPQAGQVADAVATVGEHDHQVAQHLTAVMRASTHAQVGAAAKLRGQPQPV